MDRKFINKEELDKINFSDSILKLDDIIKDITVDESSISYNSAKEVLSYIEDRANREKELVDKIDSGLRDLISQARFDLYDDYKYRDSKRRKKESIVRFKEDFEDIKFRATGFSL